MRLLVAIGIGGVVIVRPYCLGDSPVRHRQLGIKLRSMLERPRGLIVIERIDEAQALIEELLRLRALRRDRMMKFAQSSLQSGGMALLMRRRLLCHDSTVRA